MEPANSSTDFAYTDEQQRRILQIARQAVAATLRGEKVEIEIDPAERFLREPRGCFVTLHNRLGLLRGCIGSFDATQALGQNLVRMAAAATRDPRFVAQPVTVRELSELVIEVSVLTPMQPIDDPLKMRIGTDGIYIVGQRYYGQPISGCFLPGVAVEQGWDAAQTLSYCCAHKMGLAPDAWCPPTDLEFYVFQSVVMREGDSSGLGTGVRGPDGGGPKVDSGP